MRLDAPSRHESPPVVAPRVKPGDYLHSRRELYRVELLDSEHVVLEQCRTNARVEVSLDRLNELHPVQPAPSRAVVSGSNPG